MIRHAPLMGVAVSVRTVLNVTIFVFLLANPACGQLNDQLGQLYKEEVVTSVSAVQQAAIRPRDQYFKLVQTVKAPILTDPLRLPECWEASNINNELAANINEKYSRYMQGNATVETSYVQQVAECTYISYISYDGDDRLARLLVEAADGNKLCHALSRYCEELFGPSSQYTLSATTGARHVPPPPVVDFNCTSSTYSQQLDHFSDSDARVFDQVYWVCNAAWPTSHHKQVKKGHVIVFLGNEGPLGVPRQPIVFENARRLDALVILVEHRYYGDSVPFPTPSNGKLPTHQYQWLTIEQVIEDTTAVVAHVREEYKVPNSVPAMVIGGSYGGMLASYHRVVKPNIFTAAIASSAPNNYVLGTPDWAQTSERYHKHLAYSFEYHSSSQRCGSTIRQGFNEMYDLARSAEGRKHLAKLFNVCKPDKVLRTYADGFSFYMQQYDEIVAGAAQVNNQPTLLGQVSLTCNIIRDATLRQAKTPLETLSAVSTYFNHNGSASWCYEFDPAFYLIAKDLASYSYQCCTQGTVYSSELAAMGSKGVLTAPYGVTEVELRKQCEAIFGSDLPDLRPPKFAVDIKSLIRQYGGIVFTNGDADGWSGGSYYSYKDILGAHEQIAGAVSSSNGSNTSTMPSPAAHDVSKASGQLPLVAFVVYSGAGHCTDTHTFNWNNPTEPLAYKRQRALAMDYAVGMSQSSPPS